MQIDMLMRSVEEWNSWRDENPSVLVDLEGANVPMANLAGANLRDANLKGANFLMANLSGAHLNSANLEGVSFNHANLKGASLFGGELKGANLTEANLDEVDLRAANNYILDNTRTRNTRFSPQSKDPWSILRSNYTGPAMLWTVLALIAATVPYIAKVLYWSAVNRSQVLSGEILTCENYDCYTVIQLVLGFDKDALSWLIPSVLIAYNVLRGIITYKVAPMRDEEERSGYSPSWNGQGSVWRGYRLLYSMHKVVRKLLWIALAMFLYNSWIWLWQPIWVPMKV